MEEINIPILRRALWLLHCLQKERSRTCHFMISRDGDLPKLVHKDICDSKQNSNDTLFSVHQKKSDAAIARFKQETNNEDNVRSEKLSCALDLVRVVLEDEISAEELRYESSERGFVSVLLSNTFQSISLQYNNIIANFMQDFVFKYKPLPKATSSAMKRRSTSIDMMKSLIVGFETISMDMSSLLMSFTALETISTYSSVRTKEEETADKKGGTDTDRNITSLFSLLMNLLRLKESSHVKNFFFTQLLKSALDSHVEVVINYLIMHIAQEKSMVMTLDEIAKNTFAAELIREFLQPAEEVTNLHRLVLNDFNLGAFQKAVSIDDFLRMSCSYNDKLHALELIILEEIESCQSVKEMAFPGSNNLNSNPSVGSAVTEGLVLLLSAGNGIKDKDKIKKSLEDLPANELKKRFLTMLDCNANGKLSTAERESVASENGSYGDNSNLMTVNPSLLAQAKDGNLAEASCLPELLPVIAEWQVDLDEITFRKKIGSGAAGTTYLAKWRREEVAVKVATATSLGILGWNMELRVLQRLHHPNIIRMMGCIYTETPFAMSLILEYCNQGDLGAALRKPTPPNFINTVSFGLSTGMEYLHSKGVIHRDIKPDNILIHGDMETCDISVKLTDFGLSTTFEVPKFLRSNDASTRSTGSSVGDVEEEEHTAEAGTYRWMAPEVIRHESYNYKADVYSFAVVLWQLLTREKPFHNDTQEEAAKLVALGYQRPPFPRGLPKPVMAVIDRAWGEDPDERPNFDELCEIFESWSKDALSAREKAWLDNRNGHAVYVKKNITDENDEGGRKQSRRLSGSGFFARGKSPSRSKRMSSRRDAAGESLLRKSSFF